ncbi:MAG: iron-containing alcohol dehydrogenase [Oscillospiraceae bacterium]|jgi:alcohol dehydrogenase class IV|nr:iron-containing alcohol dehydrogenase [Oscillospiraceae bacterium]
MLSQWSAPNPLLFGSGKCAETGAELAKLGCKRALVIYDKGVESAGIAAKIIAAIESAGIEAVRFSDVQADPPDWSAEAAGALGVREKVDCVVGVGGGSSLDTAKAATMLQTNPPPLKQYYGREGVVTKPSVPLIVIPTTAGTGSECTPGGVITDTERGIKTNIAGAGCRVTLGIIDPELTLGLPKSVTASTGLDALCHSVESYTSARANPFSEVAGREGMRLAGQYLVRAYDDGSDLEARGGMMLASSLGGIAMSGALCHLAHDVGRSLGAKFHVPHGNGCAITLPQVLRAVAHTAPQKLLYVAEALGATDASLANAGEAAAGKALELLRRVNLPTMRDLGLPRADVLRVVPEEVVMQCEMAAKAGIVTSPVPVTLDLIREIVTSAYDEN